MVRLFWLLHTNTPQILITKIKFVNDTRIVFVHIMNNDNVKRTRKGNNRTTIAKISWTTLSRVDCCKDTRFNYFRATRSFVCGGHFVSTTAKTRTITKTTDITRTTEITKTTDITRTTEITKTTDITTTTEITKTTTTMR
jgi:hypothetical protein